MEGNAYIGLGKNATVALNDFWKYNATTDDWTAVTSFPGAARLIAVAFVVNGKAYVGSGTNSAYTTRYSDFYEYNPTDNTWSAIADLPITLSSAVAFAIGNYGYVGLGSNGTSEVKSFYKYDPSSNTWTATGTFSGDARQQAQAGVVNGKGYVIGGAAYSNGTEVYSDVQEYNPLNNSWTEKVYADINLSYTDAATYTLNNAIHLCYGNKKKVTTYSPSLNSSNILGDVLSINSMVFNPVAFVLGDKAYFGLGDGTSLSKNLYMYTPPAPPSTQATNIIFSSISSSSASISWTSGNGSKRAVFLKKANILETASPVNNTTYTANSTFGQGDEIGVLDWYCVYNSTGNNVTVTGLLGNSTYYAMVCEYLGSTGGEIYNITSASDNPASFLSLPTIKAVSGGGSYCAGANPTGVVVSLSNSEIGVDYQLLKNGTNFNSSIAGTGNTITWSNLTVGQYTIVATNVTGTVNMSGSATIVENLMLNVTISISANKTTLNAGEQVSFTSSITNGGNSPIYKWFVNQAEIGSNANSYTYTPVNGDKVYSVLISSESCVSSNNIKSNEVSLIVNATTGIDEIIEDSYTLYPNPASSILYIDIESTLNPDYLEIFSLDGKSVIKKNIAKNEHKANVDVSKLQAGIYFIKIKFNKVLKTKRFIKK